MKINIKRSIKILLLLFVFVITATISGCDDSDDSSSNLTKGMKAKAQFADTYNKDDTWLIYWYICGSDLESNGGAASFDLSEMVEAKLPPNVKVLIQAGGSNQWQNELVKPNQINRYLFDSEDLHILEALPDSDMGSGETLANFLKFGKDNYEADHKVFIFWDHGGGSVGGVCADERTGHMLSLNDIRGAFESVYTPSDDNPPFEMIGFDACLMATYDTAHNLHGLTRYMTASEELEPGCGWAYTGWLSALGNNPAMGGDSLGKVICDTYMADCEEYGVADAATLSVIDINKIPALRTAYENFGIEALKLSEQNPQKFFSSFGRSANSSENYGGNTKEQGYFDMVDIGDLAKKSKSLLPQTSQKLIDAVNEAVVYKVQGAYRDQGNGISGFYPYDGGDQIFNMYSQIYAAPASSTYLYYYLIYGIMPDQAKSLMASAQTPTEKPQPVAQPAQRQEIFNVSSLEDTKIELDKDNNAYVKLTEAQMDILSSVHCILTYIDPENDLVLFLGSDANVDADWEKGIFTDNFDGTWPMFEGHPVFVEIVSEADVDENGNVQGYNLYSVPIKLNGMKCNLQVAYDHKSGKYKILGARRDNTGKTMADRDLIKLKAGDQITTIHYAMTISGDTPDVVEVDVDTFTINDNPKFEDEDVGDGEYGYLFEFVTPDNEDATSEMVNFTIKDGEIFTTKLEDLGD